MTNFINLQMKKSAQDNTPPVEQNLRNAAILVVSGLSVAAFSGTLMKLLSDDLNAFQIAWFRFLGLTIMLLPFMVSRFGRTSLKPARPGLQIVRGLTMSASTVAFVIGVRTIDYADAIAILYAYPFLLTLLAVFFLGESVRRTGWLGVTGGFLGVLLVMRPAFTGVDKGAMFVFLCAAIIAIQMSINRKLGYMSHPLVTSFWGAVVATISLSLILPFFWQPIHLQNWGLLLSLAITGAINQIFLVYGFARAEASKLAPFTYFEIVAAVFFGQLIFGTVPDLISWAGIGLIIASGLIVARSFRTADTVRKGVKF